MATYTGAQIVHRFQTPWGIAEWVDGEDTLNWYGGDRDPDRFLDMRDKRADGGLGITHKTLTPTIIVETLARAERWVDDGEPWTPGEVA